MMCSFECTFCKGCAEGRAEGPLPELRRRAGAPPDPAGRQAREVSCLDRAQGEGRRLCGRRLVRAGMPLRRITRREHADDARRRENIRTCRGGA